MTRRTYTSASSLLVLALAGAACLPSVAEAQFGRNSGPPALRLKAHQVQYMGILEVVGTLGEEEQYRVGPDTLLLDITVRGEGNNMLLDYALDLGDADASTGTVDVSELGFEVARHWRPTLEMLSLLSIVPLTQEPKAEDESWTEITGYLIPELDLDFAEATRFRIESIDDGRAVISFTTEGGGSTTIDRPQLGAGAQMEVSRESARQGRFVFGIEEGYVLEAERVERITNQSVIFMGDDTQVLPSEVQSLTFRLVPVGN